MQKILNFTTIVAMIFLFAACKNNAQKPFGKDPALEGKRWVMTAMNGVALTLPADGKAIDLVYDGNSNTFGGYAGCNQMNGMYTTGEENMIRLHKMAVTEMACSDMTFEQKYLEMIDKTTNYKLTRKKQGKETLEFLYLYIDKTEVATYKAEPLK